MAKLSKVDEKKLNLVLADLQKAYGKGAIYDLDSPEAIVDIPRWSTGIPDLDDIIGGGMPYGRIIELFGAESSGKTSLGYHLMAQHEAAVDIPIEGTFDAKRAKVFGNRGGQLFIRRAEYGEQCIETVLEVAKAKVPIVVIDSVPHMKPRADFEQPDVEKEGRRGGVAGLLAAKLPKVVLTCEKSDTTLIFINQLRDEMNAMLFGPKTHTPGGWALRHACSIRIQVNRVEWIKIPNKEVGNVAKDKMVGIVMKLKVIKSKVCNPLGECMIAMFFDRGFVSMDEVEDIRRELMKKQNKKKTIDVETIDDDDENDVDLDDEEEDDEIEQKSKPKSKKSSSKTSKTKSTPPAKKKGVTIPNRRKK